MSDILLRPHCVNEQIEQQTFLQHGTIFPATLRLEIILDIRDPIKIMSHHHWVTRNFWHELHCKSITTGTSSVNLQPYKNLSGDICSETPPWSSDVTAIGELPSTHYLPSHTVSISHRRSRSEVLHSIHPQHLRVVPTNGHSWVAHYHGTPPGPCQMIQCCPVTTWIIFSETYMSSA